VSGCDVALDLWQGSADANVLVGRLHELPDDAIIDGEGSADESRRHRSEALLDLRDDLHALFESTVARGIL
jgi:hypothetical protein